MCIDYRNLNKMTTKDRYPLPHLEDLVDKLQGSTQFSKVDMASGYHQMQIAPEDTHKTAFVTKYGLYEWRVVPFGLANAPSVFMRMMDNIIRQGSPYLRKHIVVYLDDILIHSRAGEDHERIVRELLALLRQHKLKLKASKCEFFKPAVEFVGFYVDADGLHVEEAKVRAIKDWATPKSRKELQAFMGLAGFYRKFIFRFAHKALPLYELAAQQASAFQWTDDCEHSFQVLKKCLCKAPILTLPTTSGSWILRTDASKRAIGAVLLQLQDDPNSGRPIEKVIAYYSRKLKDPETRYPTYDRELLAIRDAIDNWRYYLHGRPFVCHTDHAALQHILTQKRLSTRQMTYLETLQQYDYEIKYYPGAKNCVADALSRRTFEGNDDKHKAQTQEFFTTLLINKSDDFIRQLQEAYTTDPYFAPIHRILTYELPAELKEAKPEAQHAHLAKKFGLLAVQRTRRYKLENNLLLHHINQEEDRICIPNGPHLRETLLREYHDTALGGHFGASKTYQLLGRTAFWPRMWKDVQRYIQGCDTCHRIKPMAGKTQGLLLPLPVPKGRWHQIGIDFIVKLPKSRQGNDCIISIIDHLTKRAHFIPTKESMTAREFATIFTREYIRLHGIPSKIITDRDVRFTSEFWEAVTEAWESKLLMSTAFHPQTDGQTEKVNNVVSTYLKAFTAHAPEGWEDQLPLAEFAYNISPHISTKLSPFELDLGYNPSIPATVMLNIARNNSSARMLEGEEFATMLHATLKRAQDQLREVKDKQAAVANTTRREHNFKVGDEVFLSTKDLPLTYANTAPESKLRHRFMGPFDITRIHGNAAKLEMPNELRVHPVFGVHKLKPNRTDPNRPKRPLPALRRIGKSDGAYEIDRILEHRTQEGQVKYKVRWIGYNEDHDEWLGEKDLKNARSLLNEYREQNGLPIIIPRRGRPRKIAKPEGPTESVKEGKVVVPQPVRHSERERKKTKKLREA
jgi:hypothetical protein